MIGKMASLENNSFDSKGHFREVCKVKTSGPTSDGVIVNRAFCCKWQNGGGGLCKYWTLSLLVPFLIEHFSVFTAVLVAYQCCVDQVCSHIYT